MELAITYLAKTIWNHPIYGLTIAPFVVLFCLRKDMVKAIELYDGTIVWKETNPVKGVPQGYYQRVAPRHEWLRAYMPDHCGAPHFRRYNKCAYCSGW